MGYGETVVWRKQMVLGRLGWVGGVVSLGWVLWLGGFGLGSVVGLGFGLGGLLVGLEQHFCLRLRASGLG